jgi:alpha-amylase
MITFGFGVHLHQPIGNFDSVIEESYQKAYKPFLTLANQFPSIKINFHISGCLLEWLTQKHPEYIDLLKELIKKGQIEILTSGFYEPILTLIPEQDRIDQIKYYSRYLAQVFETEPKGLWVAERVWEHHLTKSLVKAGVRYICLDDTHFKYSGLSDDALCGYYLTEEDGETLAIFPISKKLRYLVPFEPVIRTIEYLRTDMEKGANRFRLLFDDGEKFGTWPGTNKHCYSDGWLKDFLSSLANSDFIKTTLLSEYQNSNPPLGRIYLDNASYEEMNEWVLEPKAFTAYEKIKSGQAETNGFVRGGYFRNFLVKYPEANRRHKRMLYIARKIARAKTKARIELFKGQCNDAYWHGIFGGLYLPHLRDGVYRHLLNADLLINSNLAKPKITDFDACGKEEVVFDNQDLFLVVAPNRGGAILCLDLKRYGINLFDIIGRHRESYHQKIKFNQGNEEISQKALEPVKTIHSELRLKDAEIESYLIYDNYDRVSLLDHFFSDDTRVEDFYYSRTKQVYDVMTKPRSYEYSENSVKMSLTGFSSPQTDQSHLIKSIELLPKGLKFSYQLRQIPMPWEEDRDKPCLYFGVEFGFRPLKYLIINNEKVETERIGKTAELKEFSLVILDPDLKIGLATKKVPFDLWYFPIYTCSASEQGLERIYQGTVLILSWLLKVPDNDFEFELRWQD